jgi:hypothetical protein
VEIRTGFSGTWVVFVVEIYNPTQHAMRNVRLRPSPVPPGLTLDRSLHLIPLLPHRRDRTTQFRLLPEADQPVVALDLEVEWEDEAGTRRGRLEASSKPVDLECPTMSRPKEGLDRWRSNIRGGPTVEVRFRTPAPPPEVLDAVDEVIDDLPGEASLTREESPRGPMGRLWVRSEGGRGRRAGLLVEVTPDPRTGGGRVLLSVSANSEELLSKFYLRILGPLIDAVPDLKGRKPVPVVEEIWD